MRGMRFVYCYWMKEDPGGVQQAAPKHAAYWRRLGLRSPHDEASAD
jgi:hypothetical protein